MFARRVIAPIVIALAIVLAYWPGLYGFWTRDDYMQLAFARLVGSPWPIFMHDHYFPVPGSIFRPLGFASFWLSQALFGTDYFANACGDMVLHVAVGLALYRVIRAGEIERVPAALCTLLFALHPAVLGTALWWSARFDVLAALFGLIAVRAALDYVARASLRSLVVVWFAMLAALLSKETALAAFGAIALVWLRVAWLVRPLRTRAWRALASLVAVVAVFFVWRTLVLGTATTGLAGGASLIDASARGLVGWLSHLAGYVTFWPRSGIAVAIVLLACVFIALGDLWTARGRRDPVNAADRSAGIDLFICGICLFLLPAIIQAPIAGMNATPLRAEASVVEAAMQSRLYYFSIAGLAILLAGSVGRIWRNARAPRALLAVAFVLPVVSFVWVSRREAAGFSQQTAAPRAMAEATAAAIDRVAANADARCRIVVLGVQPPPEWSIYVSIDSIAKALTADPDRVGRCFIESDYVSYFNLMRGEVDASDAAPYVPRIVDGRPLSWLRIGEVTAAYVDPPATTDATTLAGIVFLRYENGAFVDVTRDVASGRATVVLH